jgi:hypothetical protein
MPTRQFKTTLKDAEGVEHAYSCASFKTKKSADLFLEIMEIVSGPIGNAISIVFSGEGEPDFSALPGALREIPQMIVAKGGSGFIQRILSNCRRDSGEKDNAGKEIWHHLDKDLDFDNVYAGNLLEMFAAVHWVVTEVNYGPFFAVNMDSLKGLWKKLQSFIPKELIQGDETRSEPGN